MKCSVTIRREKTSDYDEVYRLVKASFSAVSACGQEPDEQDYLNELRKKDTFIPELSLVAESGDGAILGQILLSKTIVTTQEGEITELLLSPICVHPYYFKQGVARAMIKEAASLAKRMGFKAVFLCGNPEIYERLGFMPTYRYNIYHKNDESQTAEWSMVMELESGALNGISGTVDTV